MQFEDLNISEPLQRALIKEGYSTPTPIQAEAIPHLLKGEDLMGIAQTGTGKTAAFVLPVLQKMAELQKVAAPRRAAGLGVGAHPGAGGPDRRELRDVRPVPPVQLMGAAVYGGVHQGPQVKALSRGVDALVATPRAGSWT